MTNFIHFYAKLLAPISDIVIFGPVTLDLILHFIIGALITIILLKYTKLEFFKIFLIVLLLELFKEFCDSFILTSTLKGHLVDIFATMIYPVTIGLIRRFK